MCNKVISRWSTVQTTLVVTIIDAGQGKDCSLKKEVALFGFLEVLYDWKYEKS